MNNMFCFQCEQTAGCTGCTGNAGVCGKPASNARLQDDLTGALVRLARTLEGQQASPELDKLVLGALFTTVTNVNFDDKTVGEYISSVHTATDKISSTSQQEYVDYSLTELWNNENEDIRSLKSLILFGLRGMAAYAYHAMLLGYTEKEVSGFFYKGLAAIGENGNMQELLPITMELGQVNLKCMELLDKANTETYGTPVPTEVSMTIEKGPFIIVTGHDLKDLDLLLQQTDGKGINIYTHGEMLPGFVKYFV